jgi:molybdopterin biosynthesis enzyme MoaB
MTSSTNGRLTHQQIREACGAKARDKEMTCPCCGHSHLQLFGDDGAKCQNGCTTEQVTAEIRQRLSTGIAVAPSTLAKPKKAKLSETPEWQGFTLDDYCQLKKLNKRVLEDFYGVREVSKRGKTVVAWPYFDDAGKLLATKYRLSSDSHDTYFEPADPHVPYGLNNPLLKNMVSGSYDLLITEGESDCHTFGCWGFPVIGISGNQGWLPEYAELPVVGNAKRVLVCEDQDEGGKTFASRVLKDIPQALILRFEGAKDPSELHLKHSDAGGEDWLPHPFIQSLDIAIQTATLQRAMRQPKAAKTKPSPMREEAFYGLAGKIVKLLEPQLEASREAILANVLGCSAVLFQHEAYFKVTADIHYPDDYYLTVGNSAVARKGTTTNAVLEVLERVRPGFGERILRGLSTGQGLITALSRKRPGGEEKNEEAVSDPIAPAVLIEISEFAELLAVMRRDENTLSAVLRDAWDGKRLAVLTRTQPLRVQNVSLATIAHITQRELLERLTSTDKANGFANRHIFIWMERVKLLPRGSMDNLDCDEIIGDLNAAIQAAHGAGAIKRDAETEELWAEEYKHLSTRGDSMIDALLSRAEAHVMRLSLLYALLDGSREIRKVHLKAALAVWHYSEASVQYVFGHAVDGDDQKILKKLEQNGPLTADEIRTHVFSKNKSANWVGDKLSALEQTRQIRRCQKEFKTKTSVAWEYVGSLVE